MPSRYYLRQFVPGSYYHIYNRGAHRHDIFHKPRDYQVFTQILAYYLTHPLGTPKSILDRTKNSKVPYLVKSTESNAYSLLCYCLMPNHFHLMVKQVSEDITLSNLMKRLSITYAMYYNDKYHHSGAIFQGKYKNVLLETDYQWLYLSKYIHRNPLHLQGSVPCNKYLYSSYQNYLGKKDERWVDTSEILTRYHRDPYRQYADFVEDGGDSGNIEKLTLDSSELQY